jgi:hypothetical protein
MEETSEGIVFTRPEVDGGLWEMLEVYGRDSSDPDVQEKVKYISDALGERPKDSLMHIITELGLTPQGDTKLGRIYKYLKLRQQADKIIKHYETVKNQMNYMRVI